MALVAIIGLVSLGLKGPFDVSLAISAVAIGLAGANAHQKKGVPPNNKDVD